MTHTGGNAASKADGNTEANAVEHGELVSMGAVAAMGEAGADETEFESVSHPARVMRIGSMIKQLLEEVRTAPLDEVSRSRLKDIYDTSVRDLAASLSPDLAEELTRLIPPFGATATPTEGELRIAQAQLVGWLEGLFHGIQATLFAQQMAARQQLEQMRGQLPQHAMQGPGGGGPGSERPGTYL
jgi:hypothetical protein